MENFFLSLWAIVLDMAPYLLLGFMIAGLLYAFVPQTLIARHMARPGFRSVLNATLLGIPLPLCSCGVIPTTVGLRRAGVSRGACTSFLISTPQTGVDSILATYSVLGLPFAIVRPIAALVTGIFGGIATDKLMTPSDSPTGGGQRGEEGHCDAEESADGVVKVGCSCGCGCHDEDDCDDDCDCHDHDHSHAHNHAHNHDHICESATVPEASASGLSAFFRKLQTAFNYAFGELLEDVGKWLAVGLIIAAVITVAVPDNFFDALKDYPFVNMLIVLAIAIPMYVCATGSIPIALSLMMKGLTPGAALVLLMAGPAINSASMLVINKAFGRKQTVIYITTIIIGAILFGLGIDYLLPQEWFAVTATNAVDACCEGEDHGSWFSIGCSILFLLLLARALWHTYGHGHSHEHSHRPPLTPPQGEENRGAEAEDGCCCCGSGKESVAISFSQENNAQAEAVITIHGMNCSHCAKNAQDAILSVPGVKSAEVDHIAGSAVVKAAEGCALDIDAIKKAIEEAGYEAL